LQLLRSIFKFQDPPYGVALVRGRQKVAITAFEGDEPDAQLRKIGFIQ
jgi:hypothetical protein